MGIGEGDKEVPIKPKLKPTRAQKVAWMWEHAHHVQKMCVKVHRLFTRNCLLFELDGMTEEESLAVIEATVDPLGMIEEALEMFDLDPEERKKAEQFLRESLRLIREEGIG